MEIADTANTATAEGTAPAAAPTEEVAAGDDATAEGEGEGTAATEETAVVAEVGAAAEEEEQEGKNASEEATDAAAASVVSHFAEPFKFDDDTEEGQPSATATAVTMGGEVEHVEDSALQFAAASAEGATAVEDSISWRRPEQETVS